MPPRVPFYLLFWVAFGAAATTGVARADPEPAETSTASRDESPASIEGGVEGGTAADAAVLDAESPEDDEGGAVEDAPRPRRERHYSDGPRRVPTPRGASRERAERLGLGTRECASRLLHGAPDPLWTAAIRGRSPTRLLWPVDEGGWVRGFGYVRRTRPDLLHRGIDIAAPEGTVVRAAADGIVAYADNGVRGYGNLLMIVHANGWMTLYAHNSRITVPAGYRVRRGERVALVGQTGIAHGPHVHFELWQAGHAVDPAALMDGGPAFVDRLAARAARRGDVPPPEAVTEEDRPIEPPLAPFAVGETPVAPPPAPEPPAPIDPLALGTRTLVDHLTAHPVPEAMLETITGRVFSTLLFPVRGGAVHRGYRSARRPLELEGEAGTAIRAAADGLVVFAGELGSRGSTVVLVHANGWVTFYERIEIAVHSGDVVERGGWLGHLGERPMHFLVRVGGVSRDPTALIVDPRTALAESPR